ncbi:hypothetical protein J7M22_18715 [Candidatus Poribacteria bacterium]|nr:hypothetical protein [Candidatus Poribacteria bacterium]
MKLLFVLTHIEKNENPFVTFTVFGLIFVSPILLVFSSASAIDLYQIHLPIRGYKPLVTLTNVTEDAVDALISFVGRDGIKTLVKVVQPYTTVRIKVDELLKGEGLIQAKFAAGKLKVIYWGIGQNGRVFGSQFVKADRSRRFVLGRSEKGYLVLADLPTEIGVGAVVNVKLYNRRGELVDSSMESIPENAVRAIPVGKMGICIVEVKDGDVICGYRGISEKGVIALNARPVEEMGREIKLMLGPLSTDGKLFVANLSRDGARVEIALKGDAGIRRMRKLIPGCGAVMIRLSSRLDGGKIASISARSNYPLIGYYFPTPSAVIEPIGRVREGSVITAAASPVHDGKTSLLVINPTSKETSVRFGGYGREPEKAVFLKPGSWFSREIYSTTPVKADGEIITLLVGYQGDRPVWAVQIQ